MGSRTRAFLVAVTLATSALADPTPQEKETARNLMDEGRDLRDDKKDLKAALQRFTAADQIMKVPTTGFEVASTQAKLGQLVEARETLARVISSQPKPGEPLQFKEARNKAQALDDALAGRIATLVVALNHSPPGVVVMIDGVALPQTLIGLPARANPGHHVIVANAKTEEGRQEIDLREGERKEITIELASRGVDHETITHETPVATESHGGGGGGMRTAGFVMLGVSGAALVTGGITGALTFTTQSDLSQKCPNHVCGPESHDELASANTLGLISTISFIGAGVLATAGIVMVIVGKPAAAKEEHARVVPWIGPGSAGLAGTF
jgi:hypothetical protein